MREIAPAKGEHLWPLVTRRRLDCALLGLLLGLFAVDAAAHDSGAVTLRLFAEGSALRGEMDLVVRDALAILGQPLDLPDDAAWVAIAARRADLARAVERGIEVEQAGAPCPMVLPQGWLQRPHEPGYVRVRFAARCAAKLERVSLHYSLLVDLDPSGRAYIALDDGSRMHSAVANVLVPRVDFDLRPVPAIHHFLVYLREGIRHVSTGYDHLLFLAALLLPLALVRTRTGWRPQESSRRVLAEVALVVSAFTVAHSITLCLATLDVARPPRRGVEVLIAVSVLVAALANLGLLRGLRPWRIAFGFGLFHGFGFAAQLGILGLPRAAKAAALLGFNLGVELGQLAAASLCVALLLALRERGFYRVAVMEVPSALIAWLASVWFVERAFGITLLGSG